MKRCILGSCLLCLSILLSGCSDFNIEEFEKRVLIMADGK